MDSATDDDEVPAFKAFSPGRIWTLARNTFTQLVRMKVFYFLLIFSLLVFVVAYFLRDVALDEVQRLNLLKEISLGAMRLFATLFAVVATSMLLPQDVEDRTLYTILAKPVPRLEYLIGKLGGMLILISVSTALMVALSSGVVYLEQQSLLSELDEANAVEGISPVFVDQNDAKIARIETQGLNLKYYYSSLVVFLMTAVVTGMTLLISTFATSSLFTIIVATAMFLVGHAQSIAREFWLAEGRANVLVEFLASVVALIFPDMQLFTNIIDDTVTNRDIPAWDILQLCGITALYLAAYTIASWFVFSEKEL